MTALLRDRPQAVAILASLLALATSAAMGSPLGLTVPVAVAFAYGPPKARTPLLAMLALAFAASALLGQVLPANSRETLLSWSAFLATAACLGAVVASASGWRNPEAVEALRIIESMPALTWSATADGRRTFVSANLLGFVGRANPGAGLFHEHTNAEWRAVFHPDDYGEVLSRRRAALDAGDPYDANFRLRRFDGVYRWFRCFGTARWDEQRRVVGWYGTMVDIDEQVHAEEALRQSERRYRDLFHYMPIGLAQVDASNLVPLFNELHTRGVQELGPYIDEHPELLRQAVEALELEEANQHLVAMFGARDAAEMRGPITRYWEPSLPTIRRSIEARYRGEEVFQEETKIARVDGSVFDVLFTTARPGAVANKSLVGFIDITERTEAEKVLRESERQLRQLTETVPALIWSTTADGTPNYVNKRLTDAVGLRPEDLLTEGGSRSLADIHPEDRREVERALVRSFETGAPFAMTYRQRRADGTYRWTDGRAEALRGEAGRIAQWYGVCVDIHDLVATQDALRERERELSHLVDMVPSYLWRLSSDGEPNFFNKRLIAFVGMSVGDADKPDRSRLSAVLEAIVHPDEVEELALALRHSIATGDPFAMRYRVRRADGVYRWMDGRAEPMRDPGGRILQWYGLSHDIDDQLRIEEALRERERSLSQLVETLPAMIDCAAPDGEPVYRSRQLRQFLGYNLEELDGSGKTRLAGTLDAGVHPDDLPGVKERYAHSLATGEPYARQHRLRRFDGEYRWVETRAAPMRNAAGEIVQWNVICLDIENEVQAQQELRRAREGMARASQASSLAELSASIAHEVNQPLAAIVANSEACHRWLSADPPNLDRAKITAERIIRDANSAADVVSRIRAVFRQSIELRDDTALSSVVEEAERLISDEAARRQVRIAVDIEKDLPLAALDRVQIQQVLINLIRNGMEAMDGVTGEKLLDIRVRRTGNLVRTEIADRGPGIVSPERIFEPFFTTKTYGMGMGLAICRSIVESHNGRLWAETGTPRGATFIFTLPLAPEEA